MVIIIVGCTTFNRAKPHEMCFKIETKNHNLVFCCPAAVEQQQRARAYDEKKEK